MEIRDVVGDLRSKHLQILEMINAIRLTVHLLEYRVDKLEDADVSRETEEANAAAPTLF